jgi:methylglutaconyl-CoA hydratase/polyketide biosynthesis enoyl-CoA hydratase PksH
VQICIERTTATLARVVLMASRGRDADDVALDGEGLAALEAALSSLEHDGELRALLLVSAGTATFCRGMDLSALADGVATAPAAAIAAYARVLERLATFPRPTLCAVDGDVQGGGVGLVAACDLVFASSQARFALPEVVWGLVPAVVWPALLRRVTPSAARSLALTAGAWSAERAQARGLVDDVAVDRGALARALDDALRQLHRASPEAVARLKAHASAVEPLDLAAGLASGVARTQADLTAPTLAAGLAALRDGTLPPWSTRWARRGEALLGAPVSGSTTPGDPGTLASATSSAGSEGSA